MEIPKTGNQYKGIEFLGIVVDNKDPAGLERVRVRVRDVFDGIPDSQLPWCVPKVGRGLGSGGGSQRVAVPVQGSLLYVVFQNGDPLFPQYIGSPITPSTTHALFQTNYPDRYGWVDPKGNHFYVDMKTGDIEFKHKSGTMIHVNPDGSAMIHFVGPVTSDAPMVTHTGPWKIIGNVEIDGNQTVTGNVGVNGSHSVDGTSHSQGQITSDQDIVGGGISLMHHVHTEQGDGADVSPPH